MLATLGMFKTYSITDVIVIVDVGNNADLYAANQGSTELINEAHAEEAPLRFMGQDVFHVSSSVA